MSKKVSVILDASALLALINQEQGAQVVKEYFPDVAMSAVNVAEVATVLGHMGIPSDEVILILNDLVQTVIPFERKHIYQTAFLREKTKHLGLSFADRACLTLGLLNKQTILTADKAWGKLQLDVDIKLIR
ncbi:MAG: type II toxin-antitoxin system VapC family toxin [Gammaproteobacteria bacterium]